MTLGANHEGQSQMLSQPSYSCPSYKALYIVEKVEDDP